MNRKKTPNKTEQKTAAASIAETIPVYLQGAWPYLIIAIIAFSIYSISLGFDFTPMDERWIIQANKTQLSDLSNFPGLYTSSILGMYYRPNWLASLMLDTVTGSGSTFTFHLTNILLHLACSLLIFRLLLKLNIAASFAFFSAVLFAVHPVNLHAVAWVPGRNDSLLCLFTVLSCLALLQLVRSGKPLWLAMHLFWFAMALLTKENAIVLPVIFFFIYRIYKPENENKERIAIFSSWLLIGIGWFFLRKNIVDFFPPVASGNAGTYIVNLFSALILYTGKVILPVQQSVMPVLKNTNLIPFLIATAVIIFAAIKFGLRNKKLAFLGLAWFFVLILIPVWAGITNSNGEQYEHRIYTSMIGAFIFISQLKIPLSGLILRNAAIVLILVFSVKTISRMPVYKNETAFLEAAVAESPSVAFFHNMIGNIYEEKKEHERAIASFTKAIELDTDRAEYYNNRGNAYAEIANYEKALEDDNTVLRLKPDQPETYINRSIVLFYLKDYKAAMRDLKEGQRLGATNISPDYARDLNNALRQETIREYSEQIRLHPDDAQTLNARGVEWMQIGRFDYALNDFNLAIALAPDVQILLDNRDSAAANLARQQKPKGK